MFTATGLLTSTFAIYSGQMIHTHIFQGTDKAILLQSIIMSLQMTVYSKIGLVLIQRELPVRKLGDESFSKIFPTGILDA